MSERNDFGADELEIGSRMQEVPHKEMNSAVEFNHPCSLHWL